MHSNLQADGGVHVLNTQQINEHPWPLSARVPRLHFNLCGTLGYITCYDINQLIFFKFTAGIASREISPQIFKNSTKDTLEHM